MAKKPKRPYEAPSWLTPEARARLLTELAKEEAALLEAVSEYEHRHAMYRLHTVRRDATLALAREMGATEEQIAAALRREP